MQLADQDVERFGHARLDPGFALHDGRAKIYEAIVKGEPGIEPGVPESFNVLVRELQSLCLDVELMKRQKPVEKAAAD